MSRTEYPDQARLVPLLWQPRDRPTRTGLSIGAITAAAIELADADGLGAVTMRAVAERLGSKAMSLYTHIPGKPELVGLMNDAVLAEAYAGAIEPAELAEWPDRLRYIARRNWELIMRHPWRVEINDGQEGMGPGLVGKYELELRAIDGIGLSDIQMDLAVGLIGSHVTSAARFYLTMRRGKAERAMPPEEWWAHLERQWSETLGPALAGAMAESAVNYPLASRVGIAASLQYRGADPEVMYRYGLELIITGLRAEIAAPGGSDPLSVGDAEVGQGVLR